MLALNHFGVHLSIPSPAEGKHVLLFLGTERTIGAESAWAIGSVSAVHRKPPTGIMLVGAFVVYGPKVTVTSEPAGDYMPAQGRRTYQRESTDPEPDKA